MSWTGEERRRTERRSDVLGEFAAISAALERIADDVTAQIVPEDRVREIVAIEQNKARWRTVGLILFPILVALGIVWFQSYSNGHTFTEAKTTADFVRNCLQHPERLTPEQRAGQCGGLGDNGTAKAVQALIEANKCFLLIQPAERTDENMNACVTKAIAGLRDG